ncbi:MAG: SurA N-terminal domain-containing protein [Eubacteriales bacterium]|nr:SurA N-terminal domain-containing protein [Eubacteriales bacterium]
MKKILCVVLTALLCAGVLTGCVFFEEKLDVAATVNGQEILWEDFYYLYNSYAEMYENHYGLSRTDPTYSAYFTSLRDDIIDSMIDAAILEQKCREEGILPLSAENAAEARANLDKDIRAYKDDFIASEKKADGDAPKSDEVYEAMADEEMKNFYEKNNTSYEKLLADYERQVATTCLKEKVLDGVAVTENEIKDYYDQMLAEQKADFDGDADQYEDAVAAGETIFYAPAGYRWVSHVLFMIDEDAVTELRTLRSAAASAKASADATEDEAEKAEYTATYEAKTAEAEQKLTEALGALDEKVAEFYRRLGEGETWEALHDEYNDDKASGFGEKGYLIGPTTTGYVEGFLNAALGLTAVGEYNAEPTVSDYGYHVVRMDIEVPAGDVPLDDLREEISTELLASKQSGEWTELFNGWRAAAEIKINEKALAREK